MLVVFEAVTSSHVTNIFFRAGASLWTCCYVSFGSKSVTLLIELPSLLLLLYDSWELLIGSTMSSSGRSFLISILLKYGTDEAFERTKELLKLTLLGELFLLLKELKPSMSIATPAGVWVIWVGYWIKAEVGKYIFANSLIGTIIQDRSKRKRHSLFYSVLLEFSRDLKYLLNVVYYPRTGKAL